MPPRKNQSRPSERLFVDGQAGLFEKSYQEQIEEERNQPVECLGLSFANDEERRAHFLGILREKLKDPEFRKIEGFPIGTDEDILALSDPPYYTACPNPFLADFVKHYGTAYDPNVEYRCEPFAADVSEGKNEPVYNAHRYHTKVPPKAIVRYLAHYTSPGDFVLDGFAGTGMLGVAAQWCAAPSAELRSNLEGELGAIRWGPRNIILGDLSPIASFIAYNQSYPPSLPLYREAIDSVLADALRECGWLYESRTKDCRPATIYHTVWSEVLLCPNCSGEMVFWDVAVDPSTGKIAEDLKCPSCGALCSKRQAERATEAVLDPILGKVIAKARYVPVAVRLVGEPDEGERPANSLDRAVIARIGQSDIPYTYPTASIERDIDMWYERDYRALGLFTLNEFYTRRNLWALAALWSRAKEMPTARLRNALLFTLTAMAVNISKMNCWRYDVSFPYNPISGTLYVAALPVESNVFYGVKNKSKRLASAWSGIPSSTLIAVTTQSCSQLASIPDCSMDYVFTDPPFGSNIIYSDLNLLYEGWLRVETNTAAETVVHRRKKNGKDLIDYRYEMTACLTEYRRVLKPRRWLTMVFHNTKNAVWIAIQEALNRAGLVVADVRVLDKGQGSFKQLTTSGAAKHDLVISAYKPDGDLEERFKLEAGTAEGAWDFVRSHLRQLPCFVGNDNKAEVVAERQSYLLFDRMVAFHVQRGVAVPLSAAEFYAGLEQRFPARDGMYFLSDQVAEYDRKRMTVREVLQLQLFVSDEASAIQWLRLQLLRKPQTAGELNPQYMQELGGWQKSEKLLELDELLEQNFLRYDGRGEVPSQIHSYLSTNFRELRNLPKDDEALRARGKDRWYVPDPNKAGDLEKLREKALLRDFEEYRTSGQKRLKVFRLEAVRAGFKKAWQDRNYGMIVAVASKIPEDVLQEDPKLLMWYDQAVTRMGGNS